MDNIGNIENTSKGLTLLDNVLWMVDKYKISTILKSLFLLLLISFSIAFASHPAWIFDKYIEYEEKIHAEKMSLRLRNTDKIQSLLEKNLYKIGADRIVLLELHNGANGEGGLPFYKCSATYESINDGVYPVSSQYQSVNLSLMPFATYLFQNRYFYGTIEDIADIDRALYYKMASNSAKRVYATVIEGVDKPIAFLFVTFQNDGEISGEKCDIDDINHLSLEIALLLELNNSQN